ncbi:MAG: hypothetical protein A3E88_02750 [Legionellales bacterium RIFCSPHIGHO2_12_FULL_35_11]|nr:MAG: hypothetical protein A3E88_02750 [Legionellales bacterium RIFCSPHIGHO2_12_FULL_35_11]
MGKWDDWVNDAKIKKIQKIQKEIQEIGATWKDGIIGFMETNNAGENNFRSCVDIKGAFTNRCFERFAYIVPSVDDFKKDVKSRGFSQHLQDVLDSVRPAIFDNNGNLLNTVVNAIGDDQYSRLQYAGKEDVNCSIEVMFRQAILSSYAQALYDKCPKEGQPVFYEQYSNKIQEIISKTKTSTVAKLAEPIEYINLQNATKNLRKLVADGVSKNLVQDRSTYPHFNDDLSDICDMCSDNVSKYDDILTKFTNIVKELSSQLNTKSPADKSEEKSSFVYSFVKYLADYFGFFQKTEEKLYNQLIKLGVQYKFELTPAKDVVKTEENVEENNIKENNSIISKGP